MYNKLTCPHCGKTIKITYDNYNGIKEKNETKSHNPFTDEDVENSWEEEIKRLKGEKYYVDPDVERILESFGSILTP